uniref:ATP synthase subunit O, mitochondrial n=1 Tax=Ipomoea batatas TaxID=4120 RepID=ATPO_IPOBA|nr:RecName: Full=ATP synthase subunit O, mitochondrial; AltName: Full=Oligomycin sensitivity conferral protein; Short=OSCP; Flags: Precursor [Ipomoea batatas]AAA33388.1 F-1-ATPase delta subunit precursor (EC 3.6.1.3) [Ipomoea batatas]GMD62582.1 ATP synthase subunit O, mitochondrial-like [Ipomoea batatas]
MAMTGRARSMGFSILQKALSSAQRSNAHRSILCPTLSNSELLRNYATASASKEQKIKVPLTMYGVSGNYASALYLAAVKSNTLEKVESELYDLVEASKKSPTFSQFMRDPSVPVDTRVNAIKEICAQAKFGDTTQNFLLILAENGRLKHIDRIVKRFKELTMAHRGEVKATVTTVIPLPADEEKELKATLQEMVGQGKSVQIEQKIDPTILGGLVVEFGQKVFDMSIRTRARQMERFLREPLNF